MKRLKVQLIVGLAYALRPRRPHHSAPTEELGKVYSFGPWLTVAARRLHRNILTIALANKLARIALTVLVQGRSYETRIVPAAA